MTGLVAFLAGVFFYVAVVFNGYALSVLWGWFMVPTFGLPPLAVAPAIGVSLVVSFLTNHDDDSVKVERSSGEAIGRSVGLAILRPAFALFFGWIVHFFM